VGDVKGGLINWMNKKIALRQVAEGYFRYNIYVRE